MKTMKNIAIASLIMTASAMASYFNYGAPATKYPAPENAATGIWIQQIGDIIPQAPSNATLYYTKYNESDRVKSISYKYDGAGYLLMKPSDKKILCTTGDGLEGADGIVHHPDGKHLLVAGQGNRVYKVRKETKEGERCKVGNTSRAANNENGDFYYHLMNDPNNKYLWAAGIPHYLFRFSTEEDGRGNNFAEYGYKVTLTPDKSGYRQDNKLSTLIWDGKGQAYFTYSDYAGGGCEYNCTAQQRKEQAAKAYFGVITDTTWTKVTSDNVNKIGGKIGESVITELKTKILIDSLEGCHGGTYDPYSKTIFVFGGSKIVQIEPFTNAKGEPDARVVAHIDLREFFFDDYGMSKPRTPNVGWRLDQGTTDNLGHLFVAANTGHVIFVDFAGNRDKRIDNNVLVHVQWVDNYLDDLAPLTGVTVKRTGASTDSLVVLSSSAMSSSALVTYSSERASSSVAKSSSSGNGNSSGNDNGSSGNDNGSSGNDNGSSGNDNGSSGNDNGSSGNDNGSSGNDNGSSGNDNGSSANDPNSSGSNDPNSSGSNDPNSSGSGDPNSSGSNDPNSSDSDDPNSSDSGDDPNSSADNGYGDDEGPSSSSKNLYYGADDEDDDDDGGFNGYPSADSFEKGDSLVSDVVLVPTTPEDDNPNAVTVGGNKYLLTGKPAGENLDLHYNSGKDTAWVGNVVAITLDADKVKEYFGDADSLKVAADGKIELIDPNDGSFHESIFVHTDGSITILITAQEEVRAGTIKVYGNNNVVVIDNINFYDPIPDAQIGYIKDTDGDKLLDYVEVLLRDTVPATYNVYAVKILIGNDVLPCTKFQLNKTRDRVIVDAADLKEVLPGVGEFPKDAKVQITYKENKEKGVTFVRETALVEVGSNVIKESYAIRDTNKTGMDSLFIKFNIDLIPADVSGPELLVLLKQEVASCREKYDDAGRCAFNLDQVKRVYMPAKDIVILVGDDFHLLGDMKDSVSLYPGKTFNNLQYVTSDEYEREVPVTVVDRFPSFMSAEYWDTDGDGVLDQIVSVFDRELTLEELDATLYLTFPWFSSRGMMTYLQADPSTLIVDSTDATRIIWNVTSTSPLAKGLTDIDDRKLPQATAYTYYKIFGETFVSEATAKLVDRMSPIVSDATLNYGKKADTLMIRFSEPILTSDLEADGRDCFSYIHGSDTLDLNPIRVDWSADGYTAKLLLDGSIETILPGDSLIVKRGKVDVIKDNERNVAGEHPQAVIIGGLLNHLVESTQMGSYDVNDDRIVDEDSSKTYTLQTVSSVNLRYVPGTTTKEDMEKEGALGHLVQLGERFVPQLLDRAQVSSDGTYDPTVLDSLDPKNVYISFIVNYLDHLGQYVNDTIIDVPCESAKFGGNCLKTDQKVFVNWNFKDHNGRFVGNGVYTVQFKMIVRYEDKRIEEELKDKWGVRRKKHSKKKK